MLVLSEGSEYEPGALKLEFMACFKFPSKTVSTLLHFFLTEETTQYCKTCCFIMSAKYTDGTRLCPFTFHKQSWSQSVFLPLTPTPTYLKADRSLACLKMLLGSMWLDVFYGSLRTLQQLFLRPMQHAQQQASVAMRRDSVRFITSSP